MMQGNANIGTGQKTVCRLVFLLLCLIPTCYQGWVIVSKMTNLGASKQVGPKPKRKSVAAGGSSPTSLEKKQGLDIQETGVSAQEHLSKSFTWTARQGLEAELGELVSDVYLERERLPVTSTLRRLLFDDARLTESAKEIRLIIADLELLNTDIEKRFSQWVANQFQVLTKGPKRKVIEIETLRILSEKGSQIRPILLRGVRIECVTAVKQLQVNGRFVSQQPGNPAAELPFQLLLSGHNSGNDWEWKGQRFPCWIFGKRFSDILGTDAELSGAIRIRGGKDEDNFVNVKGRLQMVAGSSISTWLNPASSPLVEGLCEINCRDLNLVDEQIQSFDGELIGPSTGQVHSRLASLLGDRVQWIANREVAEFRSLFIRLNFDRSNSNSLTVSGYENGKLLAWSGNGQSIMAIR